MSRAVKIYVIDLPPELEITYEQVTTPDNLRRYIREKGQTLPGDIGITAETSSTGGWYVEIWETPDLPEPA